MSLHDNSYTTSSTGLPSLSAMCFVMKHLPKCYRYLDFFTVNYARCSNALFQHLIKDVTPEGQLHISMRQTEAIINPSRLIMKILIVWLKFHTNLVSLSRASQCGSWGLKRTYVIQRSYIVGLSMQKRSLTCTINKFNITS